MSCSNLLSFFLLILAAATITTNPSHAAAATATVTPSHGKVTKLVNQVCKQTSSYKFCVDSLYSDPGTPSADGFSLADISFRLADRNATGTLDGITHLLNNPGHGHDRHNLETCKRDCKTARDKLTSALNDLNSETFFTLAGYANAVARAAADCRDHYPPLTTASRHLKSLCEIGVAVSKLLQNDESISPKAFSSPCIS